MNRKTPEEILDPLLERDRYTFVKDIAGKSDCEDAMRYFALQEMASFAEWVSKEGYQPFNPGWKAVRSNKSGLIITEPITTQQLITKFYEEHGK